MASFLSKHCCVYNSNQLRKSGEEGGVLALIMCPVRELAMQVKSHLDAVSKGLGINVVAVVGGLAEQRQERLLKCLPEIVVATPGRFWELAKSQPYLSDFTCLRYLVLDEVDRILEPGRFKELSRVLEMITAARTLSVSSNVTTPTVRRQTFFVSATLPVGEEELEKKICKQRDPCSPHDGGGRRRLRSEGESSSLGGLIRQLCLRPKPAVLNLTKQKGSKSSRVGGCDAGTLHSAAAQPTLPKGLSLAHVKSLQKDKVAWLYIFLMSHPGRTMVFLNSIKLVRYLAKILSRLELRCGALHSQMRQRARLKSLDRFRSEASGVLVATDVAARGLDVPNIDQVVHYDIPNSLEPFIHRSGRTARASSSGVALCIVSPQDDEKYHKVCEMLCVPVESVLSFFNARVRVRVNNNVEFLNEMISCSLPLTIIETSIFSPLFRFAPYCIALTAWSCSVWITTCSVKLRDGLY